MANKKSLADKAIAGIGDVIADIREKLIDEGWFGRKDHERNAPDGMEQDYMTAAEQVRRERIVDCMRDAITPQRPSPYAEQGLPASFEEFRRERDGPAREREVERELENERDFSE